MIKRFFYRHLPWLHLPSGVLIALLQRTPVLRCVAGGSEAGFAAPVAAILKSAAAALASLGAYDSLAGATTYALVTNPSPNPYTVAVGSSVAVGFTITPAPQQISSFAIGGNLPPGVVFGSGSATISTIGFINVISQSCFIQGVPTTPGTYVMTIQAFESTNASTAGFYTNPFTYTLVVTGSGSGLTQPAFTVQPAAETIASGSTVVFNATATGNPAPTYQWYRTGALLAGATSSTLVINAATAANAGTYTCVATNAAGSVTSSPATLSIASTTNVGRLTNISTRASVGTGSNILIAGFVVGGAGTAGAESVLIRGVGPALATYGVTGLLKDPQLTLYNSGATVLATDTGWNGSPIIASENAAVGAFPFPAGSADSALFQSLASSPSGTGYSAQVAGASGDSGVALVEIYDATPSGTYTLASPRLINISSRAVVGTGSNIMIAGIIVGGTTAKTVLIRASGPALAAYGITGYLSDPQLSLYNAGGTLMASNTGWANNAQIAATAASVGAFTWPVGSVDSALLVTLPPGNYTAQVAGASGDTGISLIEVYDVP